MNPYRAIPSLPVHSCIYCAKNYAPISSLQWEPTPSMAHTHHSSLSATQNDVSSAASRIGFEIPPGQEEEYLSLLQKTDIACQLILDQEGDYRHVQSYVAVLIDRLPTFSRRTELSTNKCTFTRSRRESSTSLGLEGRGWQGSRG